jgi:hypothetical protein
MMSTTSSVVHAPRPLIPRLRWKSRTALAPPVSHHASLRERKPQKDAHGKQVYQGIRNGFKDDEHETCQQCQGKIPVVNARRSPRNVNSPGRNISRQK